MLLTVLLTASSVFAAGQQEASAAGTSETMVLRCGLNNPDGHPLIEAMKDFASILEEKSEGRYRVEFYTGAQLGDKKTHMTSLQTGTLDMWMIMGGFLSDYGVEILNVMMLPYLFDSVEHARAVQAGPIGDQVLDAIQKSGTRTVGIGMYQEAPRNFFFSDNPVTTTEDMKNLKIRAQAGSIYVDLLESFGASVVPVAFSELYSALQTGVVDGAEQPYSGYYAKKFYEVAPYYLEDGHEISPNYVLFSEITWNTLSADDQALIRSCFKESVENFNRMSAEKDQEMIQKLKSSGVIFLEVQDADVWKSNAVSLYGEFAPGWEDLIKDIQSYKY
jgi:tripartite ATP-independent transporter DctP family solute receptor